MAIDEEHALTLLQVGLEAEAGDLQTEQLEGVKSQMRSLMADLEKGLVGTA